MSELDLSKPQTRVEGFLAKTAGAAESLPSGQYSRLERFLAKIAGEDVQIPSDVQTRIEGYLKDIAENGGGVPAGLTAENIKYGVTIGDIVGTCPCANLVTAPPAGRNAILVSGDFTMNSEHAYLQGSVLYWNGINWHGGGTVDDNIHSYRLPAEVTAYYVDGNFYIEVESIYSGNEGQSVDERLTSHINVYTFDGVILNT